MPSKPNYFDKESPKSNGPDFFKKDATTKISKKHEKDTAKRFGGKRVPGSGNISGMPGDVADTTFLHECKATKGGGTQIQANWVKNISTQALAKNRIPLLQLRFEKQEEPTPKDWVMLPVLDFLALLEKMPGVKIPDFTRPA